MEVQVVLFLIYVVISTANALQYCDGDCKAGDGYFCIKDDPTSYSICSNGARIATKQCATGLFFDVPQKACNWPSMIVGTQCPCQLPTTTTLAPTTTILTTRWTGPPPSTRPPTPSGLLKLVCYFTNWAVYRPGLAKYTSANVDPFMCTHIIVAFMKLANSVISYLEAGDNNTLLALTALRDTKNPSLKIMVAVGGWDAGSGPFIDVISSTGSQQSFIRQAISFLRKNNLDGLDIDWEYPTGYVAQYSQWMASMRSAFENEAYMTGLNRLLLTAAVSAGASTIDYAYDIHSLSKSADFINLMSYDLNGPWSPATGLNSAISSAGQLNVRFAASYWTTKGADPQKLIIGIPMYGRPLRLCNPGPTQTGIGSKACGAGNPGAFTASAGFEAYYESCLKLQCKGGNWTSVWDSAGQAPFMYSGNQWITYENVTSIAAKVNFVKSQKYGGVMVWALDLDDFNDICGTGVKSPLMSTLVAIAKNQSAPILGIPPKPLVDPCNPTGGSGGSSSPATISPFAICDNNCAKDGLFCLPDDPSAFYQCQAGTRYPKAYCSPGLLFNYKTGTCDWPANHPTCTCPTAATTTVKYNRG